MASTEPGSYGTILQRDLTTPFCSCFARLTCVLLPPERRQGFGRVPRGRKHGPCRGAENCARTRHSHAAHLRRIQAGRHRHHQTSADCRGVTCLCCLDMLFCAALFASCNAACCVFVFSVLLGPLLFLGSCLPVATLLRHYGLWACMGGTAAGCTCVTLSAYA